VIHSSRAKVRLLVLGAVVFLALSGVFWKAGNINNQMGLTACISRQEPIRAKLMKANVQQLGAPVAISAMILSVTLEELIALIHKKCPSLRAL